MHLHRQTRAWQMDLRDKKQGQTTDGKSKVKVDAEYDGNK